MNISEYIKNLRDKQCLSIKRLGRLSGVDPSHISRIEGEKRNPSPTILRKLAPFLGTTYENLMQVAGYIEPDLTLPTNKELIAEGVVVNLIKDLVSKRVIKDSNDIPDDVMQLLMSAVQLEVKLQCDNYHHE